MHFGFDTLTGTLSLGFDTGASIPETGAYSSLRLLPEGSATGASEH